MQICLVEITVTSKSIASAAFSEISKVRALSIKPVTLFVCANSMLSLMGAASMLSLHRATSAV